MSADEELRAGSRLRVQVVEGRKGRLISRAPDGRVILFDKTDVNSSHIKSGEILDVRIVKATKTYLICRVVKPRKSQEAEREDTTLLNEFERAHSKDIRCCSNPRPKYDKRSGEIICKNCGTVLVEKTIGQLGGGTRSTGYSDYKLIEHIVGISPHRTVDSKPSKSLSKIQGDKKLGESEHDYKGKEWVVKGTFSAIDCFNCNNKVDYRVEGRKVYVLCKNNCHYEPIENE